MAKTYITITAACFLLSTACGFREPGDEQVQETEEVTSRSPSPKKGDEEVGDEETPSASSKDADEEEPSDDDDDSVASEPPYTQDPFAESEEVEVATESDREVAEIPAGDDASDEDAPLTASVPGSNEDSVTECTEDTQCEDGDVCVLETCVTVEVTEESEEPVTEDEPVIDEPVIDESPFEEPVAEEDPAITFDVLSVEVDAVNAQGHDETVRSFGLSFSSLAEDIVLTIWEKDTNEVFHVTTFQGPTGSLYVSPGAWTSTLKPNTIYAFSVTATAAQEVEGSDSVTYVGAFLTGNYPYEETPAEEEEPELPEEPVVEEPETPVEEEEPALPEEPVVEEPVAEETVNETVTPALSTSSDGSTCTMHFGARYIGEAASGQVRGGEMPGMSWGVGPTIEDLDGDAEDLEWTIDASDAVAGTYVLTYVSDAEYWADYGKDAGAISSMPEADRAFITCDWWDAVTETNVGGGGCNLKVRVAVENGNCEILPAGNMGNYTGE